MKILYLSGCYLLSAWSVCRKNFQLLLFNCHICHFEKEACPENLQFCCTVLLKLAFLLTVYVFQSYLRMLAVAVILVPVFSLPLLTVIPAGPQIGQ